MLPVTTSSELVLPAASALSPVVAVEAPAAVADTSNAHGTLDDDAVRSDGEGVVV